MNCSRPSELSANLFDPSQVKRESRESRTRLRPARKRRRNRPFMGPLGGARKGAEPSVFILSIIPFRRKPTLDLEQLYRQHAGMVARRVRRFVGHSDVEEVVHEVFLKAYERQDSFRGDASPVTWLYHIATNHCLNRIRDRRRRAESLSKNKDLPWLQPRMPFKRNTFCYSSSSGARSLKSSPPLRCTILSMGRVIQRLERSSACRGVRSGIGWMTSSWR